MAITATTVQELVQSIDTNIRNKTARNSITPTTHSDVLTEAVQVLSGYTDANIIYVDANKGSDVNGLIGSKDTAFKTIKAARDYGTGFTDSIIYVMEGVYRYEHNLQRNGDYYFEPETYIYVKMGEDYGGTNSWLFSFTDTETPVLPYRESLSGATMSVYGHGNFICEAALDSTAVGGSQPNAWGVPLLRNNSSNSSVYFECRRIKYHIVGGAVNVMKGVTNVKIKDGIYGLPLSGVTGKNGGGVFIGNGVDDLSVNIECPYINPNGHGMRLVGAGTGSSITVSVGTIENRLEGAVGYEAVGIDVGTGNPSIATNVGSYSISVRNIVNLKGYGTWHKSNVSGDFNLDINTIKTKDYPAIAILNNSNEVTPSDQIPLTINYNISEVTTKDSYPIYFYNLQYDAKYYFNGNFTTLSEGYPIIRIDKDTTGSTTQFDGTYTNYGTGATSVGITIDSGEPSPLLGDTKFHTKQYAIDSTTPNSIDVLTSAWFETEPSSAITVTGNYTISGGKSHVSELNISSVGSGTSVGNLGVDSYGNVVMGSPWNVIVETSTGRTASNNEFILISAGTHTVTLPTISTGVRVGVKQIFDGGPTTAEIKTQSGGKIDGVVRDTTGLNMDTLWRSYVLVGYGTDYFIESTLSI